MVAATLAANGLASAAQFWVPWAPTLARVIGGAGADVYALDRVDA
jgi:hypothetical protein